MKKKQILKILFLLLFLLQYRRAKLRAEFNVLDTATLLAFVEKGPLINQEANVEGKLKFVTAGVLVEAPVEQIWKIIRDYKNYPKYIKYVKSAEILEQGKREDLVKFHLKFTFFTVVRLNVKYIQKNVYKSPNRMDFRMTKGDFEKYYGFWETIPVGDKTILFHGAYPGLRKIWLINFLISQDPQLEFGIANSSVTMAAQSIKEAAEAAYRKRR